MKINVNDIARNIIAVKPLSAFSWRGGPQGGETLKRPIDHPRQIASHKADTGQLSGGGWIEEIANVELNNVQWRRSSARVRTAH